MTGPLEFQAAPQPGERISHYEIQEKLGEGGMGVVYRARDVLLDRSIALKLLPPDQTADPARRARFVREARAASALNHPNIVVIHEIETVSGRDFIAMEYVPGRTLREALAAGSLPVAETLRYAVQIADALEAAHAAGLVHRDIKPANIMITPAGRVKLLDFGLAKSVAGGERGPGPGHAHHAHVGGRGGGNGGLYVARTGARPARGCAVRHVLVRRGALPDADGPRSVPGRERRRADVRRAARGSGASERGAPRHPQTPGGLRGAGSREGRGAPAS